MFRSGGRAEAKPESLAKAMTYTGVNARVVLFDRAGQSIGTKRFWALERGERQVEIASPKVLSPA